MRYGQGGPGDSDCGCGPYPLGGSSMSELLDFVIGAILVLAVIFLPEWRR